MKKGIFGCLFAWICLLMVGCQDVAVVSPVLNKSYESFEATIADIGTEAVIEHFSTATTRSHLADGHKVLWDDGDSIGIFSDKQGLGKYSYSNGVFHGDRIEGNEFHAFYPYKEDAIDPENPNLIHTRLHYGINYKEGTYYRPLPMVAMSDDNELQFKHTCGILHFSIKGSCYLNMVYLFANDESEMLCGNGVIDLSEETPILKMVADDEVLRYRVDYRVEDYLNPEKPLDLYFIVPVGVYKKGIRLLLKVKDPETGEETYWRKKTEEAVEIRRGVIKSYSVVDYDEMLQEELDSRLKERQALMDFYNSTDGANWIRNDNWGSDKPLEEWFGVTMNNEKSHVKAITLYDNGLKGKIPSSIGDLKELYFLGLAFNELTGELPETMGNLKNLWLIYIQNNQLTGTIPDSFMNLSNLEILWVYGNHMDGTLSETLVKSDWWNNLTDKRYDQAEGYKLKFGWLYESTDFSEDGKVVQLQAHTEGNGIPIVITCDAFSDRMMDTFEKLAHDAMENFFDAEPYTTFRSYFDVYMVKAVSRNEVVGEDIAFSTHYDNGDMYASDIDKITEYSRKALGLERDISNDVAIVLIHGQGTNVCYMRSYNINIALCEEGVKGELQHEAGGHGLAFLGDEYTLLDPTGNTYFEDYDLLDYYHQYNWYSNIDYHSDPTQVYWSDFIANSDYAVEKIGLYEGAWARYSKGIYRSTENSIMRDPDTGPRFNAPSRWIIYQRIKDLAGMEYTFEDFLEYDKKNLAEIALEAQTRSYVEKKQTPDQQHPYRPPFRDCITVEFK